MAGSITISDLYVRRGDFCLDTVNLSIAPQEVFAILGQTGSGKTVLLESIAGAFPFESGSILLDEKDVNRLPVQQRHLGIVYQDYALFQHMDVYDNIAYGLTMNGFSSEETAERTKEMLELFSIGHIAHRYPGVISGGESQRTALARALVLKPEILLLDEPFAALDPATKERMYDTLRNIHKRFDCTIVFVTHDFHEAQILADRIGIILNGRLCAVVESHALFEHDYDEDVRYFLGYDKTCTYMPSWDTRYIKNERVDHVTN